MAHLTIEQQLYLLYASAYLEAGTVTKGTVKSYLPKHWKDQAEEIYTALQEQKFIEQTSRGRFSVTEAGTEALVINLSTTDYRFDSVKGPKVINTLLVCIQEIAEHSPHSVKSEEMSFDEFKEKFKSLYFEEKRQQEIRGVVAIHSKELCQKFLKENLISQENLNQYFEKLKLNQDIFAVDEKGNELIQWVE